MEPHEGSNSKLTSSTPTEKIKQVFTLKVMIEKAISTDNYNI